MSDLRLAYAYCDDSDGEDANRLLAISSSGDEAEEEELGDAKSALRRSQAGISGYGSQPESDDDDEASESAPAYGYSDDGYDSKPRTSSALADSCDAYAVTGADSGQTTGGTSSRGGAAAEGYETPQEFLEFAVQQKLTQKPGQDGKFRLRASRSILLEPVEESANVAAAPAEEEASVRRRRDKGSRGSRSSRGSGGVEPPRKIPSKEGYNDDSSVESCSSESESEADGSFSSSEGEEGGRPGDVFLEPELGFNLRFQEALEGILALRRNGPSKAGSQEQELLMLNERLGDVATDFMFSAELHAQVIVSELHLPYALKSLKPADIGGIAGGDKYLTGGILFKVASANEMYDNEEAAGKVAAAELSGFLCLFNSLINNRNLAGRMWVPLAACVDFRGHRVFCETLLPVRRGSLRCGTDDAGKTMRGLEKLGPEQAEAMRSMCADLNIKVHLCRGLGPENRNKEAVEVAGPADLELHDGKDGRSYVLDVSRLMPAMAKLLAPDLRERMSHLYELFRPEFVARYPVPLNSDGFSNFAAREERDMDNRILTTATEEVVNKTINMAALDWVVSCNKSWEDFTQGKLYAGDLQGVVTSFLDRGGLEFDGGYTSPHRPGPKLATDLTDWVSSATLQLCRQLHARGINLRFLGVLYMALSRFENSRLAMDLCMIEMVARVSKTLLKRGLRNTQQSGAGVTHQPLLDAASKFANLIFGRATAPEDAHKAPGDGDTDDLSPTEARRQFWLTVLAPELGKKYFRLPRTDACDFDMEPGGKFTVDWLPHFMTNGELLDFMTSRLLHSSLFALPFNDELTWKDALPESAAPAVFQGAVWNRLIKLTGMRPGSHVRSEIKHAAGSVFSQERPFRAGDIKGFKVTTKSLTVVDRSYGFRDRTRARASYREGRFADALRHGRSAFRYFGNALASTAGSVLTLRNLATTLDVLAAAAVRAGQAEDDLRFAHMLDSIQLLLEEATLVSPRDIKAWGYLGAFFLGWRDDRRRASDVVQKLRKIQARVPVSAANPDDALPDAVKLAAELEEMAGRALTLSPRFVAYVAANSS